MPQFVRLKEKSRPPVTITVDGATVEALEGDTLLTALLTNGRRVRESEFGDGARAGFCVIGACQDCWVWMDGGERTRACTTYIVEGMTIFTHNPEWPWTPPA
ncbi:MAG: (2Fe-2S)-binding protein [Rhodospirillales bacterium]|jgi:NADH dehydrogenase/NADH:ubiquinone oxidoreductase subunit G|nr:(2Fe-2S)-binding protein [Rhodospirillales bacterium]